MLTLFTSSHRQPSRFGRACALLLTGTVLMLAVLAVCPAAHHWLHADADHEDHECAITMFAQGVTTAVTAVVLAMIAWRLIVSSRGAGIELFLTAPRYLHVPGRAPPLR